MAAIEVARLVVVVVLWEGLLVDGEGVAAAAKAPAVVGAVAVVATVASRVGVRDAVMPEKAVEAATVRATVMAG